MNIKLIALDLDGTALNEKSRISDGTRRALEAAAAQGVNIVIATGRPFTALPQDVLDIDAIRYVITSNGACITDLENKEIIYRNCLSPLAAEKSVELLRQHSYIIEAFTNGDAYMQADYWYEMKRTGRSFRNVEYLLTTRAPMEDIYGFILDNRDIIENINVNFEDVSEKPEIFKLLQTIPEATITSSFRNNLEIGGATTSKADALTQLGGILGVDKSEMMAAGDSLNDMAMLKAAGFAVAMGNGEEEIKAAADYVTLPNSEDGVAVAIEKFVLNT